jgi:hypothetical protein
MMIQDVLTGTTGECGIRGMEVLRITEREDRDLSENEAGNEGRPKARVRWNLKITERVPC